MTPLNSIGNMSTNVPAGVPTSVVSNVSARNKYSKVSSKLHRGRIEDEYETMGSILKSRNTSQERDDPSTQIAGSQLNIFTMFNEVKH